MQNLMLSCILLLWSAHKDLRSFGFVLFCSLVKQGNQGGVLLMTNGTSCSCDVSGFCFAA